MPRKQKKYHYIYKTTCQVTGKFYVGMHSTSDLADGYLGSGKILGYSIAKHGVENHKREILEFVQDREALKLREKEIVNEELLAHPLNINLKYGGEGGGGFWSTGQLRKSSIAGNQSPKRNHAIITKKILQTKKERGTANFFGGKHDAFLGKHHTTETKQRMSVAASKRTGEKNSQFGTCWVTNGTPIKIKLESLDEYLANGYQRGRSKFRQ